MTTTKGARTRTRMIEAMVRLLQDRGYSGTGVNTVVSAADAPRGSLYFHFPDGKEELGEEAVRLAAARYLELLRTAAAEAETAGAAVSAVITQVATELSESDFRLGCPVSVVALETGSSSDRLRAACAAAYRSWTDALAGFLTEHGMPREQADRIAVVLISTVEGAIIISRTHRDTGPLLAAAATARELVDR